MSSPAYGNRPSDPITADALTDLALDLRWSYNHAADQVWDAALGVVAHVGHEPDGQDHRGQADRDVDDKDPAP